MGWSCTKRAGDTLEAIQEFCVKTTGSQNTYKTRTGETRFFELGREKRDGHISGMVYAIHGNKALSRGSFSISADGLRVNMPGIGSMQIADIIGRELVNGSWFQVIQTIYADNLTAEDIFELAKGGPVNISVVMVRDINGKEIDKYNAPMFYAV